MSKHTPERREQSPRRQRAEAKAALRTARKEARAALARDKEAVYALRKTRRRKFFRAILWLMLGAVFLRGVVAFLRPDPAAEVYGAISDFRAELARFDTKENEAMAFAESFAMTYFTYGADFEDYTTRLGRYASQAVLHAVKKPASGSSATATYAGAYRQELSSEQRTDVWTLLRVTYSSRVTGADGSITTQTQTQEATVKIAVGMQNGMYLALSAPVFVSDAIKWSDFKGEPALSTGPEVDTATQTAIQEALNNFYTAYYGDQQGVVNYYLDPSADGLDFAPLHGRVAFQGLSNLRAFRQSEADTSRFTVLVTVTAQDANSVWIPQTYNLSLVCRENRYYISAMDVRGAT